MISPVAPTSRETVIPSWIDAKLIELTILTWAPSYGRELTQQEAIEILVNFGRFVDAIEASKA